MSSLAKLTVRASLDVVGADGALLHLVGVGELAALVVGLGALALVLLQLEGGW